MSVASSGLDLVTLVDRSGQKIGELDKFEAHRGEGRLHLACSVFLFAKDAHPDRVWLLIQQRSLAKIVGQGQWANTICGNVRPSETPLECAYRRLQEELNLSYTGLVPVTEFYYQTPCNEHYSEHEYDHLFAGWLDQATVITPNPQEASATSWLEWPTTAAPSDSAWKDLLSQRDFAPWLRLFVQSPQIRLDLQKFITGTTS